MAVKKLPMVSLLSTMRLLLPTACAENALDASDASPLGVAMPGETQDSRYEAIRHTEKNLKSLSKASMR